MTKISVQRPVLRYHGGKWILAPWIISHFPKHRIYTEVFGGGASVLLRKPRSYAEVYNDLWDTVVNVFEILRNPVSAAELRRRIELTPFARAEFDKCGEIHISQCEDLIEKARLTIFRSFAGFGSASTNAKHSTGFRAKGFRQHSTAPNDWMNYPSHIDAFTERLKGVVIEKRDYSRVLQSNDTVETLHYLDPPYVHTTRNLYRGNAMYAHEMSDDQHAELSKVLKELEGMVVLSGYDSKLYQQLFKGWPVIKRQANADGGRKRIECLWLNPRAAAAQKQFSLF